MDDIYQEPIDNVDLHARLYRECEAMIALMAGRGISCAPAILERITILDLGISKRQDIPIKDLVALHAALAEVIRPALPQSVELLHWDATRRKIPFWDLLHFLAPVSAVRKVILFTILCFFVFFAVLIFGPLTAEQVGNGIPLFNTEVEADMASAENTGGTAGGNMNHFALFCLTLFYVSLSAIGACFATLYDANRYVCEGTYDPRRGSSYAIRIGLGMMSGFLLSQVLFGLTGDARLFGRVVLALLGGFAGELIYHILNKLVGAVESVFKEDPRSLVERITREAEVREQAAIQRRQAAQTVEAVTFAAQMEAAGDPAARAAATREFLARSSGTEQAAAGNASDPVTITVQKAAATAAFLRRALEILPSGEGAKLRDALDRLEKGIARVRNIDDRGELAVEAAKLGGLALAKGPLKGILAASLGKLAGPLAPLGISPGGLALMVVTLAGQHGAVAYRRWKARVLNAPYLPDLLPVDPIDAAAVQSALDDMPDALAALQPGSDDMAALNRLGQAAADLDHDSFFDRFGRAFAGTREEFDAAVAGFRDRMRQLRRVELDRLVTAEIPEPMLNLSGAPDRGSLLAALDTLQKTPETLAELEKLFLMAAAMRDSPTAAIDLQLLREALAAAEKEAMP